MMMADSVEGEGSNAGGSGNQEQRRAARGVWEAFRLAMMAPKMAKERHQAALAVAEVRRAADIAAFATAEARRAAFRDPEARRAVYANVRAYDHARVFAHIWAYVLLAMKASGLLALLLSTVILLGGYVQSLGKKDFFCIMTISVIQAAGIFQDWVTNIDYVEDFLEIGTRLIQGLRDRIFSLFPCAYQSLSVASHSAVFFSPTKSVSTRINEAEAIQQTGLLRQLRELVIIFICTLLVYPFLALLLCVDLFYLLGPLACAGISSWRIAMLNHGNHSDGTDSMTDMMATLSLFYSLIVFQGAMFFVLLPMLIYRVIVARDLRSLEQLSDKWGMEAINKYLSGISKKCTKDPLSIKGMDMIKYGAELLDSDSPEDYLYGARLLSAFVKKGEDVTWLLLPSRHRIQRLIDSLMISSSSLDEACVQVSSLRPYCFAVINGLDDKKEIREHAATIVAHVAAHIDDLAMYPGAMRCISSLFQDQEETTQTYRQNSKQIPDDPPQLQQRKHEHMRLLILKLEERRANLMRDQKRMEIREHGHRNKREGGTSNELVQQGLTILERLASNSNNNRRLICSTQGLLPKITAPIYSATLIEDVKIKTWADIVTRCLKVLYQLIRAPGRSSRRLRRQIFSKHQALSNLRSILVEVGNEEAGRQELQLVTMEILTELALDLFINLTEETKKVLVTKQLQLFLLANADEEEESAATAGKAMVSLSTNTVGRAMVSLSTNSESNSALIMTTENDITGRRLIEILDDKNITRRTIAKEIMANLCAHCDVDNMKEILAKVLKGILSIKTKSQERKTSARQNSPAVLGDEENQGNSVCTNIEESHSNSWMRLLRDCGSLVLILQQSPTKTEEISDQEREEQEAFLSLAQVICDKLSSADLDGAIQNAMQNENNAGSEPQQRHEAFVDKLKAIIEDNYHPAADSLRIVKLCSQIAKSVMRCEQYVEIFRYKGFKSSLSEASKTMSELESCMRFVGTDFGPKKTVRPLFSEIEKSFGQI